MPGVISIQDTGLLSMDTRIKYRRITPLVIEVF